MDDLLVVNVTVGPLWAPLELSQEPFTSTETVVLTQTVRAEQWILEEE